MTASIRIARTPQRLYLLRIADACLILGQRLGEWCGHAPALEEDLALTNMALDLIGQARALLTHAGRGAAPDGGDFDEDQLAFLRDERDYRNPTLCELPNAEPARRGPGDFAFTVLRNLFMASWFELLWQRLQASSDAELAAIAGKAVKEARYHRRHAAGWLLRLGDGSDESRRRLLAALPRCWAQVPELFAEDDVDAAAQASGLGPSWAELRAPWRADMAALFGEAGLALPAEGAVVGGGRRGMHSEHMGHLLAEMQSLQRAYPGGAW